MLGDLYLRRSVLNDGGDVEIGNGRGAARDLVNKLETKGVGDADGGHVGALFARRAQRARQVALDVVVDDGADGTGEACVNGLEAEFAGAARDEGNVARDFGGVIGLLGGDVSLLLYFLLNLHFNTHLITAEVRNGNEGRRDVTTGRVLHQGGLGDVGAVNGEGGLAADLHDRRPRLQRHIVVVAQRRERLIDVRDRVVVGLPAHDAVTLRVGVREALQLLLMCEQCVARDGGLELVLRGLYVRILGINWRSCFYFYFLFRGASEVRTELTAGRQTSRGLGAGFHVYGLGAATAMCANAPTAAAERKADRIL